MMGCSSLQGRTLANLADSIGETWGKSGIEIGFSPRHSDRSKQDTVGVISHYWRAISNDREKNWLPGLWPDDSNRQGVYCFPVDCIALETWKFRTDKAVCVDAQIGPSPWASPTIHAIYQFEETGPLPPQLDRRPTAKKLSPSISAVLTVKLA